MKRLLAATVAGALVAGMLAGPVQAEPRGRWNGPCSGWEYGENLTSPAKFNADLARSHRMMVRLIRCVFDRFAPGNAEHALYVAHREAGDTLLPWAVNVGGCGGSGCLGMFQHMGSAWDERARLHLSNIRGMFNYWPPNWSDPRANAIVSAKMVRFGGWGPWGG